MSGLAARRSRETRSPPQAQRPAGGSMDRHKGVNYHIDAGMRTHTPTEPSRHKTVYRLKNSAGGHPGPRSYFNP